MKAIHVFEYRPRAEYGGGLVFAIEDTPAYHAYLQDDDLIHLGTLEEFARVVRKECENNPLYGGTGFRFAYVE